MHNIIKVCCNISEMRGSVYCNNVGPCKYAVIVNVKPEAMQLTSICFSNNKLNVVDQVRACVIIWVVCLSCFACGSFH